jgi:glycosyltransferase involved in cell wall biosynthesis
VARNPSPGLTYNPPVPEPALPPSSNPQPSDLSVDVVLPALNEEASLPRVLADLPARPVRRVVVADNGSSDGTARVAREGGAVVVPAPRPGYGSACLAALDWLRQNDPPDVVVFLDADYSDHPEELPRVVAPILEDGADLVIGSRVLGDREPGALLPQARAGNLVACWMIRILYGHRYTDLGPFRAIRWRALERLAMCDPDFGWTAEMQVKALRHGLRVTEVPVSYRKRIGVSKITGTVKGTVLAGYKILWTVLRYSLGRSGARGEARDRTTGRSRRGGPH